MNPLLNEALSNYEIKEPQIEFIRHNENETYKIKDTLSNNQFVIRINKPSVGFSLDIFGKQMYSVDLLMSEMAILNAISKETNIPVQIPIKNKNGELVTVLRDGTPVTLLTWRKGDTLENTTLTNDIMIKIGEMVGKLHRFSEIWCENKNLNRYFYNQKLLEKVIREIERGIKSKVIPIDKFKVIEEAVIEINNCINELHYKNSKFLVHSDLSKSNLIMNNGSIIPIDFSLCGYSYYYMDLGSLFSHFIKQEQRYYILSGYSSIIDKEINTKYIEAFMVFQIILFISTHIDYAQEWDWFNETLDRWCKDYFIPFSKHEAIVTI